MNKLQLEEYKTLYQEEGVVRIPNVFSKSEMEKARASALLALGKLKEIKQGGYPFTPLEVVSVNGTEFPAILFWPSLLKNIFESLRTDQRLAKIVQSFLGNYVKQLNNQIYYRLPGDNDSFAWHQDIMFRSPRSDYPNIVEQNGYLQTAIIIDSIDSKNAPIKYVIGSQKLGEIKLMADDSKKLRGHQQALDSKISELPIKTFPVESGDVLVWSALTVHGSSENTSENSRMYYMNGFAKGDCSVNWPTYLKDGQVCTLNSKDIPDQRNIYQKCRSFFGKQLTIRA